MDGVSLTPCSVRRSLLVPPTKIVWASDRCARSCALSWTGRSANAVFHKTLQLELRPGSLGTKGNLANGKLWLPKIMLNRIWWAEGEDRPGKRQVHLSVQDPGCWTCVGEWEKTTQLFLVVTCHSRRELSILLFATGQRPNPMLQRYAMLPSWRAWSSVRFVTLRWPIACK